jgi:hypothetical protein
MLANALLALALGAADVDYQREADAAAWEWAPERATLNHSLSRAACDYRIEVVRPKGSWGELTIRFVEGGKPILTVAGHGHTTFGFRGDVVYYADYHPSSSGCAVVAYDLKARKELWKARLQGLGPIEHTKYRNAVALEVLPGAVRVQGLESAGKYLEYVDLKTGKTIGHRVFKE